MVWRRAIIWTKAVICLLLGGFFSLIVVGSALERESIRGQEVMVSLIGIAGGLFLTAGYLITHKVRG